MNEGNRHGRSCSSAERQGRDCSVNGDRIWDCGVGQRIKNVRAPPHCGSGFIEASNRREESNAVYGTGCAGVRG
ncbi:hypothetical protein DW66_1485 [Pseudomonas putida]|nr:hypothetical protein DW66_1151 [Pseudomonas putida]AHZ76005.1 hypothetical protein DW66_1485 [Pseudomonas putida]AJG15304.1 hypothetical protein RK21_03796 [Pseudomonas plecoglossicida]